MQIKIRKKIAIIVGVTVVLVAGLFILRNYYGDKFAIFADLLQDEKVLVTKTVLNKGFDKDQLTNLEVNQDALQISDQSTQVCGNSPASIDTSGFPQSANFALRLNVVADVDPYLVTNFNKDYYIGDTHVTTNTGNYNILPADNSTIDQPGFSITRGNGWLKVELDANRSETDPSSNNRNAVNGTITFPANITLKDSIRYDTDGDGLENASDGTYDFAAGGDEIILSQDKPKVVEFHLSTSTRKDIFYINYCSVPAASIEGSLSGAVDLGSIKPISSIKTIDRNYISETDNFFISAQISKDGQNWIDGREINARAYNFQGVTPRDSYCFRYIKFNVRMTSDNRAENPLGLEGLEFRGGDVCGTEQPLVPGDLTGNNTACSNGFDDDSDGKIDFDADPILSDPGCSSKMDDSESDPGKICADGSAAAISLKINIERFEDAFGNSLDKKIYVGTSSTSINSGDKIILVADGLPALDMGVREDIQGLSMYRGEGYFFILNKTAGLERQAIQGNFEITGSKITKVVNYHFDDPTDGIVAFNESTKDEYSINPGESSGTFTTAVQNGVDGFYVFYDYSTKIGGACQCQDAIDNDKDTFVDYPDDFGCSAGIDNDELQTQAQIERYPVCKNGIDDDKDGDVDYPADKGCESVIDDNESEPVKVCRAGDTTAINVAINDYQASYTTAPSTIDLKVATGDNKTYASGEKISLVENGESVIDNGLANPKSGSAYIKRGPGYIYILFKDERENGAGDLRSRGKITFEGTKITKIINGTPRLATSSPFEIGGGFDTSGQVIDHYSISADKTYVDFDSYAGSDSLFVFYDNEYTLSGGCACEDGLDNDNDGLIDSKDPGCADGLDTDETNTIVSDVVSNVNQFASEPTKILPSLIVSGTGFWALVIVILAISGISVYVVIKKDKKNGTQH